MATPRRCVCADRLCPIHAGAAYCRETSTTLIYRIDMDDTGQRFCDGCAEDALASGVFSMAR